MPSIFELTTQQAELMNLVDNDEISKEDAADTFEGMQGELNDKINDYCRVRQSMVNDLLVIENEIERLTDMKARKKNQIKNLTNALYSGLDNIGTTKFDTGLFNGHFRKGSKSLKVTNSDLIPDKYVVTKVTESVDKTQLKKDLVSGAIKCEGAEIVTGETSLIIK